MADYLEYNSRTDNVGYVASASRPDGRNAIVVVANRLTTAPTLGDPVKNLSFAMEQATGKFKSATDRFSEQGFKDDNKSSALAPLGKVFRETLTATVAYRNELNALQKDFATPRFPKDDNQAPIRAELRDRLAAMKPLQAVEAAINNFDMAAALMEGGEAVALTMGISADMYASIAEGFAERNLANMLIGQRPELTLKPTANDVLRNGPDIEAAKAAAKELFAAHRASYENISNVEALLNSVVDFVAVTMDTYRDPAFDALMAA